MIIIITIIILLIIYLLTCYNSFIKLNNQVKESFSTMDVYLKKRWDLIPNLVETVKGYAKHEKDTLEAIIKLRNDSYDQMNDTSKLEINNKVSQGLQKIMILAEKYPELKADKNFLDLQKNLGKIEDEIAQSRKYYNATVRVYNNKVEMFPSNIFARIFGFKTHKMFEATADERNNVEVKL